MEMKAFSSQNPLFEAETIHVPGNIDGEEVIEIMESILTSIKKMLGITEEYEHFDSDLIIHINSVFMILTQLGVVHHRDSPFRIKALRGKNSFPMRRNYS